MLQSTGRFLLCAFLATLISPIVADYVIDVKFIKFENYNRLLANGRTCINFGTQQCQTTLHVCARPDDTSTLCRYGETKTGVIGDNVIDLNKTFIGFVRNPITYQIKQPFQKFVISFTAKSNNELIADFVYQSGSHLPQRSVEEARYNFITTRGSQNPTTQLTYQIRSYCSQGYYGPNCITRCYIPTSEQTRFQCDINGQKVCKPGVTGPFCNPNANQCRSAPCKNSGTCVPMGSTFRCICKEGYTGPNCINGIDDCKRASSPCLNGGTCVDGINNYSCRCAYGYTGSKCENVLSACLSAPCMNGGRCSNAGTSFVCHCLPNFYDHRCQTEDKCRSVTCLNGGRCVITNFVAKCKCQPEFTGPRCGIPINSCQSSPCQNDGRCQLVNDQITCTCVNGFNGNRCQFPRPCYLKCQNGGTCYPNGVQFTCRCPFGFTGQRCEQPFCAPNICQNGGTCQLVNDQITCTCANGFYGNRCQFPRPCYLKCQNGGTSNVHKCICDCPPRWTGKFCEIEITSCSGNPCLHGGQCYPRGNSVICTCPPGWTGQICEIPINQCTPNPCQNNGYCRRLGLGGFVCDCHNGWYGKICDNRTSCPSSHCFNGGTCIQNANMIRCRCPLNFTGEYCEVPVSQAKGFKCPETSGLFPDPQSCRHFYHCDWNIAYRKDCPGNLHFNKVLKVCDWQYRADCNIRK